MLRPSLIACALIASATYAAQTPSAGDARSLVGTPTDDQIVKTRARATTFGNSRDRLRLDAVGNELRAFVNGVQSLQAIDSSHAIGQGGILTYKAAAEYVNYLAWQP